MSKVFPLDSGLLVIQMQIQAMRAGNQNGQVAEQSFGLFYLMEDLTKMKIPSEINPPLLGKESVARL